MEEPDLLQLTQEALDLAATACHFDKEENYVGAYDYYDKCILNLDEVLGKLPPTSTQWRKLMEIRTQYDDRMDQLKEIENSRGSLASFSLGFNKNTTRDSESGKSSFMGTKKKKVQEEFIFHEIDIAQDFTFEEPPKNVAEVPFWQLRNVKKSIEQGAFFTKSLFISKNIWCQSDVKFSGVNAKTAAFEIILNLVANDIESLYFSSDDDSITLAEHTFLIVEEELLSLRNQLSKSFPYIKEVVPEADKDDSSHLPGQKDNNSQHNSPAPPPAAGGGNTMRSASPAPASATSTVPSDGSSHSSSTSAPLPASSASSKNKSLTHMVSAFGKSMKKYADIGLHRLAVALPSRLSSEDLQDYTGKICKLCDKIQLLVTWIKYIDSLRQGALVSSSNPILQPLDAQDREKLPINPNAPAVTGESLHKVNVIAQSLVNISAAIRDIVCEILLRDVEYLLDRYMHHTRRVYTRMQWDQDYSASSDA